MRQHTTVRALTTTLATAVAGVLLLGACTATGPAAIPETPTTPATPGSGETPPGGAGAPDPVESSGAAPDAGAAGGATSVVDASGTSGTDAAATDQDPTTRFVLCLAAADVQARIDESGFVQVRYAPFDGGERPTDPGVLARVEQHLVHATADEERRGWVVPLHGAFFTVTEPHVAEAWDACQAEHPRFRQLTWDDLAAADPGAVATVAAGEQAAIDFARRARQAGFAWVADPEPGGAITLPAWITEAALRDLLTQALDPSGPWVSFTAPDEPGFAWRDVVGDFAGAGLG